MLGSQSISNRGEGHWPLLAAALIALIARIDGIGESTAALLHLRRQADTQILVRSLYEHVLTYCWIAIDPRERVYAWRNHAAVQRKTPPPRFRPWTELSHRQLPHSRQ